MQCELEKSDFEHYLQERDFRSRKHLANEEMRIHPVLRCNSIIPHSTLSPTHRLYCRRIILKKENPHAHIDMNVIDGRMTCLEHGNSDGTSGKTEETGLDVVGTASEDRDARGGSSASGSGTVGRCLDLTVGDLRDRSTSGSGSLDLTVGDLGDRSTSRSRSLDLTVGDLGDSGTAGGGGRGLDLAVGDLSDRLASGGLDLTVRDLSDRLASRGLDLAVRDLGNARGSGGGLDLTVGNLGDLGGGSNCASGLGSGARRSSTSNDVNVDGRALATSGLVVEVVEVSAQALVEDARATKGESAVGASREASGVDGTSLDGVVELELTVGSDVTSAALVVGELAVAEGDLKSLGVLLTSLKRALRLGNVDNGDLELSRVVGRASCGSRLRRGKGRGHCLGLGEGSNSASESESSVGLHGDDSDEVVINGIKMRMEILDIYFKP